MSVSVRTRFEVFKRDRFTCAYCGKHPPDVLLQVDHIVPRAAGGSDSLDNLATACADCNQGKSDRLLEEGTAPTVPTATVDALRERLAQAEEYARLLGSQEQLIAKQQQLLVDYWAKAFGAEAVEEKDGTYWHLKHSWEEWPNWRSVRLFIRRLPINEILAAVDITSSRHHDSTDYACRLFYKLCWRRIKGESGAIDEGQMTNEHGPDRCVSMHEHEGIVESIGDRAYLAETMARILAIRVSELTGESEEDVLQWAESEAQS